MMNYLELFAEMEANTIYLVNPEEDAAIKIAGDKAFAKFEGGDEYEVAMNSKMVTTALIAATQISEEEYTNY